MSAKKREKKKEPEEGVEIESAVQEEEEVCPYCKGYGYVLTETGEAVPCECREGMLANLRLQEAHIPRKFAQKSLANFKGKDKIRKVLVEKAAEFIQNFRDNPEEHQGILMVGCTGSGKTHLALAILREIVVKGYTGLYYNVPELLNELRDTYNEPSEQIESDILNLAGEVGLLVLDDLGAERTSGWVRDRLFLIINRRYEALKPILVTTNLDWRELEEQVGERIVSRLYEMCPLVLEFPREDYRRQYVVREQKRRTKRK